MTDSTTLARRALSPVTATPAKEKAPADKETAQELGFDDLIDAVNPLQHLPGVSAVYREASGDSIGLPARLAGGLLFGGPMGLLGSAALAMFEEITGDSPLGHLVSLVEGSDTAQMAEAAAAPNAQPWLKAPGGAETATAGALPSRASLDAALAKLTPAAETAMVATMAATAAKPAKPLPAPETLAKLYELQATQPREQRTIKV